MFRDIPYREGESEAWRLDLAMPVDSTGDLHPALVIVHGGGWRGGSRTVDVLQKMMTDYATKGYVTINIDYRLTGEAPFPACIEDVKCAVRWLRAHADEYGVDPNRIGAYGHSAGAHLAMMLAMVPNSAGLEGDGGWEEHSSLVNAAVGGSPPTELGRETPMAKAEWWPIGYISGDHPPMLLIQGGADRIVRAELTEDFVTKMQAAGADIEYLKIDASKVAAMGMSCGGLQAIQISSDPRISTTVVCNSGVLPTPSPLPGMPPLSKDVLKTFHGPVLYIMGGPSDIAYKNAMDDFSRVDHVPIVMTNLDVGHGGTYTKPHGGKYSPVALAWLDWQLKGRVEASNMFLGEESKLKRDPDWTIETKNFDE